MSIKPYFVIIFFLLSSRLFSQFYNLGQDPGSLRWQYYETPRFKIIFPKSDSALAKQTLWALEEAYLPVVKGLDASIKKTPVILHSKSVINNGVVVWAPRRVELYPNKSQHLLSLGNIEHLAIHELRHVAQMSKFNQGAGKWLYFLLGEQSVGLLTGLFIPLWLLEGDAVCTETALSNSGRGRYPAFINNYKALLLEKGKYSYDKAVFGSYKDFVPDHYELGYLLTAQSRKLYGAHIWSDVFDYVAKKPFTITPFTKGIKKITGMHKVKLYKSLMDTLSTDWKKTNDTLTTTNFEKISPDNKTYSNYETPQIYNDNNILAFKSGIAFEDRIVIIDSSRNEKTLFKTGLIDHCSLSLSENTLCFIEHQKDMRWHNRSYSNIIRYDIKKHTFKKLSKKARYQTASLNHNASVIAAVFTTTDGFTGMHFINTETGKLISALVNDSNYHILEPSWHDEMNYLCCVIHNGKGKAIAIINSETNTIKGFTAFDNSEISAPSFFKNYIIYTSNYSGIDNIYALDTLSKETYQLTNASFGAAEGFVDNTSLIYTNLTSNGTQIVKTSLDSLLWRNLKDVEYVGNTLFETLSEQEKLRSVHADSSKTEFEIKKYNKFKNLFKFHSWAPMYLDVDRNSLEPGVVLFSQNLLSTANTTLGYKYNVAENTGKYVVGFEYAGFYPIFTSDVEYGGRKYTLDNSENTVLATETKLSQGIRVPFNFTKGNYVGQLQLSTNNNFIDVNPQPDTLKRILINAWDYNFSFVNYTISGAKDIYPRWAQAISGTFAHTPFSGDNLGQLAGVQLSMYFPGLFKHQSLFVTTSLQSRKTGSYAFSYLYTLPRGYYDVTDSYKSFMKISTNYALPLLYPDLSIGPVIYIKRIRSTLFFDYAETYQKNSYYRSFGADILADMHIFRFIAPFELGIRVIYKPDKSKYLFEPLFSINFDDI